MFLSLMLIALAVVTLVAGVVLALVGVLIHFESSSEGMISSKALTSLTASVTCPRTDAIRAMSNVWARQWGNGLPCNALPANP